VLGTPKSNWAVADVAETRVTEFAVTPEINTTAV
jgi:hypothetical protein